MLNQLILNRFKSAVIGRHLLGFSFIAAVLTGCNGAGYEGPVLKTITPDISEVFDGDTVIFTAVVRSVPNTTYQWGKKTEIGYSKAPGATNASFSVTFTTSDNQASIFVLVYAPNESEGGDLTRPITVKPKPISFAKPLPSTLNATRGNGVMQTAELAYATAPISYQWYKNGQPIAGQNTATLTLLALTGADNGAQLTLTATNPAGSVASNVITLIVQ